MSKPIERQSDTSRFAQDIVEAIESVSSEGTIVSRNPGDRQKELAAKLEAGEPVLVADIEQCNDRAAQIAHQKLLNCFLKHFPENTESAENLDSACQNGSVSTRELLRITLDNSWPELRNIANIHSIDLDLLQLFTIYLARPFRQQMAESLATEVDLNLWQQGYCPVCGHSPVLGSILGEQGQRWLWCCCCNTRWRFPRIQCPFCMNQDQDELGYLTMEECPGYRIYVCDQCRRYLKEIISDSDAENVPFDYDIEYITSASMDAAALAQGYITEPIWIHRCDPQTDRDTEACSESKEI